MLDLVEKGENFIRQKLKKLSECRHGATDTLLVCSCRSYFHLSTRSESLKTDNKLDSLSYGNSDFEKFQIVEPIFWNFSKKFWNYWPQLRSEIFRKFQVECLKFWNFLERNWKVTFIPKLFELELKTPNSDSIRSKIKPRP